MQSTGYEDNRVGELESWSFALLGQSSAGEGTALYRLAGEVTQANERVSWSIVLKVLSELPSQSDPSAWYFWQREAQFYSSELADVQEAVQPVRCFLVEKRRNTSNNIEFWLWLKDLGEFESRSWDTRDFGFAASKIGEFNGKYLGTTARPDYSWLCKDGIVSAIGQLSPFIDHLKEKKNDPLLLQQLDASAIENYLRLWEQRSLYAEMLRFPPQTLCHFDANSRNLFLTRGETQTNSVVAIDWSYVGYGAIGADVTILVIDSLIGGTTFLEEVEQFESTILEEYLIGLNRAGWTGSPDLVRLGYTSAAIYYRLGSLKILLELILDEERRKRFEAAFGLPFSGVIEHNQKIAVYLDKLLDEARMLYDRLQAEGTVSGDEKK